MRLLAVLVLLPAVLAGMACEQPENQPATAPTAGGPYGNYPPPGYPPGYSQQGQPGYGQQPGYGGQPGYAPTGQPTAQPYPAPAPYPTQGPAPGPAPGPGPGPAPAGSGAMATPGPLALPCQSDAICGTHHCNAQYGKCAFPCQSAADCIAPNQCTMGVCTPALPGMAPAPAPAH